MLHEVLHEPAALASPGQSFPKVSGFSVRFPEVFIGAESLSFEQGVKALNIAYVLPVRVEIYGNPRK